MSTPTVIARRSLLAAAGLAAAGLAVEAWAGDRVPELLGGLAGSAHGPQAPPQGAESDAVSLTAIPATVDLGGRLARTWTFNGALPGPELRLRAGQVMRVRLRNRLPAATTIHWHGIALRNAMDGVPEVTQPAVEPGEGFTYAFTLPDPGTYFYHPHVGVQSDRGLYGPLVVEDPHEAGRYDREAVVVLDDWTDGVGPSPDRILARLQQGGMRHTATMPGMGGMDHDAGEVAMFDSTSPLGGDTGDVRHPLYLVNGRASISPTVFRARPQERLRLRLVNAGADTAFRVALGGIG